MAGSNYNASNMSEVFQMLESNNVDVVNEIKQLIYEQYEEGNAKYFLKSNFVLSCRIHLLVPLFFIVNVTKLIISKIIQCKGDM